MLYPTLKLIAIGSDTIFNSKTFEVNLALKAINQFNSYLFAYNRKILDKDHCKLGFSLSTKIRDAGLALENPNKFSKDFDVGFVPLINFIST